jgi:hypothetical protein
MNGFKPWYQSSGVINSLIVIAALAANFFGYTFSESDQADLGQMIGQGIALAAGLGALWGRIVATKRIG